MGYDTNCFKCDISNCINLCNTEIKNRKGGINGESSVEQIENIILPELNQLLVRVDSGDLPNQAERYLLSFANAFKVWGWNMQQPTDLFIQLGNLNNNYKQL